MLAARMYGINNLRVEEIPKPRIGPDEILVKVRAAAICGTDVRMLTSGAKGVDETHPLVLGHEFAGDIVEVGAKAAGYETGMRVAVAPNMGCGVCDLCVSGNGHLCPSYEAFGINMDGAFAEYVKLPARTVQGGNIAVLPRQVSYAEGALNEPFSCAYNGSQHCRIQPGDYVLIVGSGAIGLMHAKLAKLAGAGKVVISDLSPERLEECRRIDQNFVPVGALDEKTVLKLTEGHGFDVIVTACPSPAAQEAAFSQAAVNGRICFFGGLPKGKELVPLNSNLIHYKQLTVTGTTRASLSQYRRTLGFIANGVIEVASLVTQRGPLEKIGDLFDRAKQVKGLKNVVEF